MNWWDIVIAAAVVVGGLAFELGFYEAGLFWHEPKTDRRNWTPPR